MLGNSLDTKARPLHCFDCPGSSADSSCLCSHGTLIDAGMLSTRVHKNSTSFFREYNRFAEEYILAYVSSVNSWLMGSAAEPVSSLAPCRYITEEMAMEIPVKVRTLLGKKDNARVWLSTCLLKTLRSNQRWHKRHELIDDFPQVTSWLSVILKTS